MMAPAFLVPIPFKDVNSFMPALLISIEPNTKLTANTTKTNNFIEQPFIKLTPNDTIGGMNSFYCIVRASIIVL